MSKTVQYIGTITSIKETIGLEFDDAIYKLMELNYIDDSDEVDHDDGVLYSDKLIYLKKQFFIVDKKEIDPYNTSLKAVKTENGYEFDVRFYNGSASFGEALKKALDDIQEDKVTTPITPSEVKSLKLTGIPDQVINVVNELIVANWSNHTNRAVVKQDDILTRLTTGETTRQDIVSAGWLDFEDLYRKQGWIVSYDKPGYNESYSAFFEFIYKN